MIGLHCRPVRRISGNLGLATELRDLEEDIVCEEGAIDGTTIDQTIADTMTTMAVMRSEPTQKVFTETKSNCQNILSTSDYVAFVKAVIIQHRFNTFASPSQVILL